MLKIEGGAATFWGLGGFKEGVWGWCKGFGESKLLSLDINCWLRWGLRKSWGLSKF